MATTSTTLGLGGPGRPAGARTVPLPVTSREGVNGAPCLGLAILAAGALWAALGSALALLLA
jgi:hypothetical protein